MADQRLRLKDAEQFGQLAQGKETDAEARPGTAPDFVSAVSLSHYKPITRPRGVRAAQARAHTPRVRSPWGHPYGVRTASRPPICRAPWKGRGDSRRAAVRGLGTFTWGFLRHSPASVLARGKNRRDARRVSVEKPWESPWEAHIEHNFYTWP